MEQEMKWPIQLEMATYHYDEEDETPAVDNVTLQIEKGTFVAVLGHNGSGKSTCAKLMNMILAPNSGDIYVEGNKITGRELTDCSCFTYSVYADNQYYRRLSG